MKLALAALSLCHGFSLVCFLCWGNVMFTKILHKSGGGGCRFDESTGFVTG